MSDDRHDFIVEMMEDAGSIMDFLKDATNDYKVEVLLNTMLMCCMELDDYRDKIGKIIEKLQDIEESNKPELYKGFLKHIKNLFD